MMMIETDENDMIVMATLIFIFLDALQTHTKHSDPTGDAGSDPAILRYQPYSELI